MPAPEKGIKRETIKSRRVRFRGCKRKQKASKL